MENLKRKLEDNEISVPESNSKRTKHTCVICDKDYIHIEHATANCCKNCITNFRSVLTTMRVFKSISKSIPILNGMGLSNFSCNLKLDEKEHKKHCQKCISMIINKLRLDEKEKATPINMQGMDYSFEQFEMSNHKKPSMLTSLDLNIETSNLFSQKCLNVFKPNYVNNNKEKFENILYLANNMDQLSTNLIDYMSNGTAIETQFALVLAISWIFNVRWGSTDNANENGEDFVLSEIKKKHFIFNQTNITLTLKLGMNKRHLVFREMKNLNKKLFSCLFSKVQSIEDNEKIFNLNTTERQELGGFFRLMLRNENQSINCHNIKHMNINIYSCYLLAKLAINPNDNDLFDKITAFKCLIAQYSYHSFYYVTVSHYIDPELIISYCFMRNLNPSSFFSGSQFNTKEKLEWTSRTNKRFLT